MLYGPGFQLLATTGVNGYALVNGTGTIISWTAPADGQLHRVFIAASMVVSSTETGGLIQQQWKGPGATANQNTQVFAAALASGTASLAPSANLLVIAAGSTFALRQASALTGGAATLYAEIWGA